MIYVPQKQADGSVTYHYAGGASVNTNAANGEYHMVVPNSEGGGQTVYSRIVNGEGWVVSQVSTNGAGAVTYSAQAYQDSFDSSPQSLTAYTKSTDGTYDANTVLDDKLVTFAATPSATELFRLTELKAIDGVAVDNALVDAAIADSDINAHDLLLARGAVGQIVTFANPTDSDGIRPATTTPATPWTIPAEVQRLGASLTSIQGLIAAIKSGNGLGIATSSFNTLEALTGGVDGTLEDIGAGLNGATAILGLKGALERGDMLSAVSSGLTISKMALTVYQSTLSTQAASLAGDVNFILEHVAPGAYTASQAAVVAEHTALTVKLDVVGDVIKGIGKALPFISVLISLKNGDYEGAMVTLVAIAAEMPVIGWIYAGIKLIQGLLQNEDPQGEARLMAGGADGTDVWVWANGELGGEKATKDMMQAVLLKALGDSFASATGHAILVDRVPAALGAADSSPWWCIAFVQSFDKDGAMIELRPGRLPGWLPPTSSNIRKRLAAAPLRPSGK
ncbi:MAG: hypothetical protein IPO43_10610 [Rhodoferax sp.]|nr:hypothetical protein [Rhodoferax sp.]